MAENRNTKGMRLRPFHYRGRLEQIPIYFGKFLRGFVYLNDWKVLPMAAFIAGLVAMVIRNNCFQTMEGTFSGAVALCCIAIWNGCFNSIQVVCRERQIIKREHRSGMHISSYVVAHMLYQALLCLAQTVVTMYVCRTAGVRFPEPGFMTKYMIVDMGITMFLISYAADMLSLLVSSIARTTTAAMTVMPFLLIFQLVFSGGMFSLPGWADEVSNLSISKYGIIGIASQADYNTLPSVTAWNTVNRLKNTRIEGDVTGGQLMDFLRDNASIPAVSGESRDLFVGILESEALEPLRDKTYHYSVSVKQLIDSVGEQKLRERIGEMSTTAGRYSPYDRSEENILKSWTTLIAFALLYALLSVLVLERIDKDKR